MDITIKSGLDTIQTTWDAFARENMFGEGERDEILRALAEHGHYEGGGGAAASYTITMTKYQVG